MLENMNFAASTSTVTLVNTEGFLSPSTLISVPSWPSISQPPTHDLRPVDLFGPVPSSLFFPKEHTPAGARYCEEIDAFVPAHLPYRIRGLEKAPPRWPFSKLLYRIRHGHKYENLVMAMGVTHSSIELISLHEAQLRPDIVYRSLTQLDAPKVGSPARWKKACLSQAKGRVV